MPSPRIAWFSPMEPVESGISLYSQELLPILSLAFDIDVVVDGYNPTTVQTSNSQSIVRYRDYRPERYDLAVYQVGNSPAHIYMVDEVQRRPGLLVLHDPVLNHLFVQRAAARGTLDEYRDEMGERYGDAGLEAADRVLKGQAPNDLFRFPMSESLVQQSAATIVHSLYARNEVLRWHPNARVTRVPHGIRLPEFVERNAARSALGLPPDQFLIASITHISPYKRMDSVLRAFRQLRASIPARLVLAGSISPNYPVYRVIAHLGLDQVVDLPGYVDDHTARLLAAAADVIVNLRYPTAGETSGSQLHAMAAGRPVLVSDIGSFGEHWPGSAIPVPVDSLEESTLVAIFQRLAQDPALGDQIGTAARQFVAEEHSIYRWVEGYSNVICGLLGINQILPTFEIEEVPVSQTDLPTASAKRHSPVTDDVARSVAELGLGGDEDLLIEISRAMVDLGLETGKINSNP